MSAILLPDEGITALTDRLSTYCPLRISCPEVSTAVRALAPSETDLPHLLCRKETVRVSGSLVLDLLFHFFLG